MISDSGSVQLQLNGENAEEQVEESSPITLNKTEEVVQDTIRIRVLETSINARVVDMLATENDKQSENLFRLKIVKMLSAEQVCCRMNNLSDNELKYVIAVNWFIVKLEKAEKDL